MFRHVEILNHVDLTRRKANLFRCFNSNLFISASICHFSDFWSICRAGIIRHFPLEFTGWTILVQTLFLYHIFSRFCALLGQEGERLQDHWSSGLNIFLRCRLIKKFKVLVDLFAQTMQNDFLYSCMQVLDLETLWIGNVHLSISA